MPGPSATEGPDLLTGGPGPDFLFGLGGNDTLVGGAGNDTLLAGADDDLLEGDEGDDWLEGNEGSDSLYGGDGNDTMQGQAGNDSLDGGAGDDRIWGQEGNDRLYGGDGSDQLYGGDGNDSLIGGDGNDVLYGDEGNDVIVGGDGADYLWGFAGNDTIDGGAQPGEYVGGSLRAYYERVSTGGTFYDVIYYSDATSGVTVILGADGTNGSATGGGIGTDVLINIEAVYGSAYADVIRGSDRAVIEYFSGGAGNDTLQGGSGLGTDQGLNIVSYSDSSTTGAVVVNLATGRSSGAAGNDVLIGFQGVFGSNFNDVLTGDGQDNIIQGMDGDDTIDGGAGWDVLSYLSATGGVNVNMAAGTSSGVAGNDRFSNFEALRGSNHNDVLTGSNDDDLIQGHDGNDSINGGAGNDTLHAGKGVDTVDGGTGQDRLQLSAAQSAYTLVLVDEEYTRLYSTATQEDVTFLNIEEVQFSDGVRTLAELRPTGSIPRDRFEDNDTGATATDLRTISGTTTEAALSIEANDPDWYRFTLASAGRTGDKVSVSFNHALGDVDIALYDSTGTTVITGSYGTSNLEEISLAGLAAGNYLVKVYGYNGAANPDYTLSVSAAPSLIPRDRFEDNDTGATATDLRTISGTTTEAALSIEANDPDWYRFTLASAGRTGDKVSVSFNHALGDVDIALYDSTGTTVITGSYGTSNLEEISLAGLAAGNYLVRVYGYNGAANPDYTLSVSAAPSLIPRDRFEDNDTGATATDLRTISGTTTEAALSIEANDPDWYRFTLASAGRTGDKVSVSFNHALGDVDIALYDSTGTTVITGSYGTSNLEEISLAGLAAGNYLVKVYGYNGAANPDYTLSVSAAPSLIPRDRFEDNDTGATATNLRTISGTTTEAALSIEANDPDWYRFTLASAGRTGDKVSVSFNHALGDVDMVLYDSAGTTVIAGSYSTSNLEEISLAGLAAGNYLVRVYGYNGAANPDYTLSVSAAPSLIPRDRFEDNDTGATATDLRTISGTTTEAALSIEANDPDWYRFTLASAGRTGDKVSVSFNHALGDVDIALYDSTGTTVITGSYGTSNLEEISLAGLAAGNYLVKVYGYNGAANPDYTLSVSAAPSLIPRDRFEDNDTGATATNLRTISGTTTEAALSIEANDPDWYRFTLASAGRTGDKVSVSFNHALGDVDMVLYDSAGTTVIAGSYSTSNLEEISLAGLAAGNYLVKVHGYNGATNPDYALSVTSAPVAGLSADQWESNNTSGQATVIRETAQTFSGATITSADQDWFTFTLPQSGGAADRVTVHAAGPGVLVQVLNAQQVVVSQAPTDASGLANISLSGNAGGQYFVKVAGQTPATQAQYDLEVRAAGITPTPSGSSWTVLVYVNGDNNLEGAAIEDVNEMEAALNRAGVNVGVLLDRIGGFDSTNGNWSDTRRGVIVHDTNASVINSALTSLGELDLGSGAQLTNFINWGAQNLPAQNYVLIIWDHGGGSLSGSSYDDTSGRHLSNADVARAIAASQIGRVDVLGFDACLMGTIETASEMEAVADILIASERLEPGDGWDYTAMLSSLEASTSASTLAASIVDSYGRFYGQGEPLSAVELGGVTAIERAINGFVSVMSTGTATDWQNVIAARTSAATAEPGYDHYVDISSFMRAVMASSANPTLDSAAQAVITAVEGAVIRKSGPASLFGLTVEFPIRGTSLNAIYTDANYNFVADTTWENFVLQYLSRSVSRVDGGFEPGAPDFAEYLTLGALSSNFRNDSINTPFQIGTVNQADYALTGLSIDSPTDVDWFTFTMPANGAYHPTLTVQVLNSVAGVNVQLRDIEGGLIAEAATTVGNPNLTFNQIAAGSTYQISLAAPEATSRPDYELHLNAFGNGVVASALPDFAEATGGNNELAKAWQIGTSGQLAQYGTIGNLSLDNTDLQSGASGGDWFRVDSTRTAEANVAQVEVVNVSNGASSLIIKVFDIAGNLLAQSSQGGALTVNFPAQVDDIFVQVQSTQAQPILSYALRLANAPDSNLDITPPTATTFTPADEATGVAIGADLVITFSEAIQRGSGTIILKTAAGATIASYDAATSANLTIGGNTLTVNPSADLAGGTAYKLELAAGSIKDLAGNSYAGTTSYNFTTQAAATPGQAYPGTAGPDTLSGGAGNDTLTGYAGNDTLTGGLGNDSIDGGTGLDTATYTTRHAAYTIHPAAGGWSVAGPDGADSLINVERLQFLDAHLAFDIDGNAGQIYRLYKAAFARTPDLAGLGGWIGGMDAGTVTLEQTASSFIASQEFEALYGVNPSHTEFITSLYLNVFGRGPSSGDAGYWVNQLANSLQSRAQVLALFSESPENKEATDSLTANGILYANTAQAAGPAHGQLWVGPGGGVDADTLIGSVGNDTFNGGAGNDSLLGGAGIDIALYGGSKASHTISVTAPAAAAAGNNGAPNLQVSGGADGTDQLSGVERLKFDDGALAFDITGNAGQVYRLYQAAFDRTPDVPGLSDWLRGMDAGLSLQKVATGFIGSAEFQGLYGASPTNAQFIELLYTNVLNRVPDPAGYDYWSDKMDNGLTRELVLIGFSESQENQDAVLPAIQGGISYLV